MRSDAIDPEGSLDYEGADRYLCDEDRHNHEIQKIEGETIGGQQPNGVS